VIRPNGQRVSRTASIQAPTGGLNAKDPVANMDETEAVTMAWIYAGDILHM
jgi:hypothetical protein